MKRPLLALALSVMFNCHARSADSLALTPPMGWNTYNTFAGNFNEKLIREMADLLVSSGMRDAGYKTCGGYTASRGHEFQDALVFARLGTDYLKYD